MFIKLFAFTLLHMAWLIPGKPHNWARRLKAEREAGRAAMKKWRDHPTPEG